ncbi:MAG: CBM96 family carbohydrate-binding protein [Promethearchaeota archaeon]
MIERRRLLSSAFLIMFSIIVVVNGSIQPINAAYETTTKVFATKDTFVSTSEPTSNYGGQNYLKVGFSSLFHTYEYQTFIHLDFSSKPLTTTSIDFHFSAWSVGKTMRITFAISDDYWNEYNMNWGNKPSLTKTIGTFLVANDGFYTINLTNFVMNKTEVTLCFFVDIQDYVDEYIYIDSREDIFEKNRPVLIYTYSEEYSSSPLMPFIIAFALILGVIGVVFLVTKPNKKRIEGKLNSKRDKDFFEK